MRSNTLAPSAQNMDLSDFKKLLHGQMQDTLMDQYHDYLTAVKMSDDPEVKRKCVAMHISTIGAEHKEKSDPNDNLAVFQFNFTGGGMTATQIAQPAQPITLESETSEPFNLETLDFGMLNPAARVALNRDVTFAEDDEC